MKIITSEKGSRSLKDRLVNSIRTLYDRLIRIRGNPHEVALGFALGIFIGMSPTVGFQIAIAVFIAMLLKWNKLSAALGVWISNPLTIPLIYSTTYLIGAQILGLKGSFNFKIPEEMTLSELIKMFENAPGIFGAMFIGGIILGLPLAIGSYFLVFSAVKKYQDGLKKVIIDKGKAIKEKHKQKKQQKRYERAQHSVKRHKHLEKIKPE